MAITIQEAVKQLSGAGETGAFTYDKTFKDACKVGKEACLAIEKLQAEFPTLPHLKLPSQTEE